MPSAPVPVRVREKDAGIEIFRLLKREPQPDLPAIVERLGLPGHVAQKCLRHLFYDGLIQKHDDFYKLTLAGWLKEIRENEPKPELWLSTQPPEPEPELWLSTQPRSLRFLLGAQSLRARKEGCRL
jgi:hypothetical protein